MHQFMFMLILVYLAYILHFAHNYTVLKLFQFTSSDAHCCQWSNRSWNKCCCHV